MTTANFKSVEQAIKEGNEVVNQRIKGEFIGKHVYCNVNSLVEYCLNKGYEDPNSPVNFDDLENYYTYPEYYGEFAAFEGGTDEERDTEITRLKDLMEGKEELTADSGHNPDELRVEIDKIEDEIQELEELESEPQEVYEWWAVSDYLYRQLRDRGYVVIDAGSCYIWGRTTTGQAILLDGVITRICADMEILEGQRNEWEA